MKTLHAGLIAIAVLFLSTTLAAQAPGAQQFMANMLAPLELTEEQKPQVQAIFAKAFQKRRTILEAHGVKPGAERPNVETMKAIQQEMQAVQKAQNAALAAVLSEQQMATLLNMQKEQREKMRQKMIEKNQQK